MPLRNTVPVMRTKSSHSALSRDMAAGGTPAEKEFMWGTGRAGRPAKRFKAGGAAAPELRHSVSGSSRRRRKRRARAGLGQGVEKGPGMEREGVVFGDSHAITHNN